MDVEELAELRIARQWLATGVARSIRESAGLSLHELAQAVAVSPSTLLRWERGDHRPRGEAGARYARALRALTVRPSSTRDAGARSAQDEARAEHSLRDWPDWRNKYGDSARMRGTGVRRRDADAVRTAPELALDPDILGRF